MTHIHRRLVSLSILACTAIACGSTSPSAADGDTTAATGSTSGTPADSTGPGTDPATSSPGTMTETSAASATESETGAQESSEGGAAFVMEPDAGLPGLPGFCLGFTTVGHVASVHARQGQVIDATCGAEPAGCGGDIVGTWEIQAHCGFEQLPNPFGDCPGSTTAILASDMIGTRTFGADLSVDVDVTISIDLQSEVDAPGCYGATCEEFTAALSGQGVEAACEDSEVAGCTCVLNLLNESNYSGTYAIEGDALTITVDGRAQSAGLFCVAEDRLDLWEPLRDTETFPGTACAEPGDCERALGDIHDEWICIEP